MQKPPFDEWALEIAHKVKERATCLRAKVGAVLVNSEKAIISTGYNGSPKKTDECLDKGCLIIDGHCLRTTHAEINAIVQAASQGSSTRNSTMYVTMTPCFHCIKTMVNAGVKRVVYNSDYDNQHDKKVQEFIDTFDIEIIRLIPKQ